MMLEASHLDMFALYVQVWHHTLQDTCHLQLRSVMCCVPPQISKKSVNFNTLHAYIRLRFHKFQELASGRYSLSNGNIFCLLLKSLQRIQCL